MTTSMNSSVLDDFKTKLSGRLIQPDDAGFDEARQIWNAMIDRKPAMITRCTGAADVRASVAFARDNELLLAVRGGGHNIAGNALCDNGLLIDLSGMRLVRVDREARRGYVAGGATLGDFDHEAQAFGLATPPGHQFHHWSCRPDLGRGLRLAYPEVRPGCGQSHLGRPRYCGR